MEASVRSISMERKIIRISEKRQLTIPQKYFEKLGMGKEAECIFKGEYLIIRPIKENLSGEFAEQILADLISQGYQGQELLEKFKETSKKIRPAVEAMMEEAEDIAKSGGGANMEDIFGTEE